MSTINSTSTASAMSRVESSRTVTAVSPNRTRFPRSCARTTSVVESLAIAALEPVPIAPDEPVREEVEEERDQEQQESDEEQRRDGRRVAARRVRPDGERAHRRRHRLAEVERVPGEQRVARG